MSDIEQAPLANDEEDADNECALCGDEYVMFDGDKVCRGCQYTPTSTTTDDTRSSGRDPWGSWWEDRKEYDGWYGEDRIKFVGGFEAAWFYGEEADPFIDVRD